MEWRDVVYGPVKSRRLGQSLGINLTPLELKVCNFSCGYCRVGVSSKGDAKTEDFKKYGFTPEGVNKAISEGLRYHAAQRTKIDYITIAGNGEPTLYPWLEDVVDGLLANRGILEGLRPTAIFTNATKVTEEDVKKAIYQLDRRFFKLDAGDKRTFKITNTPIGVKYDEIIDNLLALSNYELSIAITGGNISNYDSFFNEEFVKKLRGMRFKRIFLYDIDIPKTTSPRFNRKTEKSKLEELARFFTAQTGREAVVLWEPTTREGNIPLYPQQIN